MHKRTVIYRGNLKSCNYSCSYCPFAKHRALTAELEKDRQNFARFCDSIEKRVQTFSIGAVFVTPYGEASIHRWYWEGLSRLAGLPGIDRVGMQTNLSFSVEECLEIFDSDGADGAYGPVKADGVCEPDEADGTYEPDGADEIDADCVRGKRLESNCLLWEMQPKVLQEQKREKLCIWATFHPEMTTVDAFAAKCHILMQNHVQVCAGAVGVPENIPLLRELREKLAPEVYLWINRMDGLKRDYRLDEIASFAEIDPFFGCELDYPEADPRMCADRCFVEADGEVRSCNISKPKGADWYEGSEEEIFTPACSRKRCTCYLSYGGRGDFTWRDIFGDYSVFRIPRRFQAVFFDLDGTLTPTSNDSNVVLRTDQGLIWAGDECREDLYTTVLQCCKSDDLLLAAEGLTPAEKKSGAKRGISDQIRRKLAALREICPIFLATSMREADVKKRLKEDMELFQGGVFASGGHLCLKTETSSRRKIYPIDVERLSEAIAYGETKARCMFSEMDGTVYKVTLIKGRHGRWTNEECEKMAEHLRESGCRFFTEKHCLEIVGKDRDKGAGIAEICCWLGISPEDVLAVGNDKEDEAMERVCGGYIRVE